MGGGGGSPEDAKEPEEDGAKRARRARSRVVTHALQGITCLKLGKERTRESARGARSEGRRAKGERYGEVRARCVATRISYRGVCWGCSARRPLGQQRRSAEHTRRVLAGIRRELAGS